MTPRAFVLMPFAAEFDEIYNLFIADALIEAGYTVQRADDFLNQRNILQDVVAGIATADLVIADLTGANPNVYYELGIAHALRRRVVLLTQSVADLPFDLRSYRVISYNTHFAAIRSARDGLVAAARGALDGSVSFGSPVTDYVPGQLSGLGATAGLPDIQAAESAEEGDGELGYFDYRVRFEEGFAALVAVLSEITQQTSVIDAETTTLNEQLPGVAGNAAAGSAKRARDLVRRYGDRLGDYARAVGKNVEVYNARLQEVEGSLEHVVSAHTPNTEAEREQLAELLRVLEATEEAAVAGRTSYTGLVQAMTQVPNLESRFDRARKEAASQLLSLIESIDRTIAVISRARAVAARLHRTSGPEPDAGPPEQPG